MFLDSWTGGREIRSPEQFVWDNSTLPIGSFFKWDSWNYDYQSCVAYYYYKGKDNIGHLVDKECESVVYGVLCETYDQTEKSSQMSHPESKVSFQATSKLETTSQPAQANRALRLIGTFENITYSVDDAVYNVSNSGCYFIKFLIEM